MLILPAIDLRGGKCVNLIQGRADAETVFSDDAPAMAKHWERNGAEYLHLVDLDGAFQRKHNNLNVVKKLINSITIPTQLGGGIRSLEEIEIIFDHGVDRAIIGTSAVKNPKLVEEACEKYGDRIAVGIDGRDGKVSIEGWTEMADSSVVEFAVAMEKLGVKTIIYTDIASDGMLKGPNLETTREVIEALNVDLIASGGISTTADLKSLKSIGATGAIVGRSLYTGKLELASAIAATR